MYLCFVTVVWLLLTSFTVEASQSLRFEHLTDKQGLSQMSVNAIVQDREGFIWLGTQDGLNRFDGHQFKIYRHQRDNPYSLASSWINALYEDRQGQLWIGTNQGVHRFDRQNNRFIRYQHQVDNPNSLSGDTVFAITQDGDGYMWFACLRGGLTRFDPHSGQFTRFYHDPSDQRSLGSNNVVGLYVDSRNTLWVSTFGGGLNRFEAFSDNFTRFIHDESDPLSISDNRLVGVFEDNEQRLWVGTRSGLNRLDWKTGTFTTIDIQSRLKKPDQAVFVWSIFQDSLGQMWLTTATDGLFLFQPDDASYQQFVHDPQDDHSISNNRVRMVLEDRSGILWFTTRTGGVNRYNPAIANFVHYKHQTDNPDSIPNNLIWSLHKNDDDSIWLGGGFAGVAVIDETSGKARRLLQGKIAGFDAAAVLAIEQDHRGVVWLGMKDVGLVSFEPKTKQVRLYTANINDPTMLRDSSRIGAIIEDKHHQLWIATAKGLSRLSANRQQFRHYLHDSRQRSTMSDDNIMSLFEARDGAIWVGTQMHGVNRLDPLTGEVQRFRHQQNVGHSLGHDVVLSITQTDDEFLWLGTQHGLDRLNLDTFQFNHYRAKEGLLNETVFGVMADKLGFIWLTTNDGLYRFNRTTELFNVYKFDDGVQHKEFSTGAYFIAEDDQIIVGGINGLNTFYPANIVDDKVEPLMVFTDFLLNNRSMFSTEFKAEILPFADINQAESIELKHTDSVFTLEFAALHFDDVKQNKYGYKLQGFDKEWVYTDARNRRATYTNLDAGSYIFQLKGSNSDNVWSRQQRQIHIKILPAPWQTWWAYAIYFCSALLLFSAFSYLRIKKHQAERQAAEVIEASEKQLTLALWGSGDQLWDWDRTACLLIRKNCLPEFGFESQVPLMDLNDFSLNIHPDDRLIYQNAMSAHLQGRADHFECVYRMLDQQQQWRWVLNRGKVVETDEKGVKRMSGTLQNIDRMRKAEIELKDLNETLEAKVQDRTQALQDSIDQLKAAQQQLVESEKMAALGHLVAGVAHEVNTPLGICITMVSMHLEKLASLKLSLSNGKLSRRDLQAYIEDVEQGQMIADSNLHRAADLIQSFKKVAVDQSLDSFELIEFHQYLQDIIRSIEPTLDSEFNIHLATQGQWQVKTYPGAWWQIVSQLVENSLTHGFAGCSSGNITLEARRNNEYFILSYRDDGNGMAQDVLDRIFEPFFTTTRFNGQTGLGMHIVYNTVVQKLGGEINCFSEPSNGMCIDIQVKLTS